jgi:hypothetical protein
LRRSRRLWEELFQQRLKDEEDDEYQNKDEEEPAFGTGLLLRIFIFGQMFTLGTSGRAATGAVPNGTRFRFPLPPRTYVRG